MSILVAVCLTECQIVCCDAFGPFWSALLVIPWFLFTNKRKTILEKMAKPSSGCPATQYFVGLPTPFGSLRLRVFSNFSLSLEAILTSTRGDLDMDLAHPPCQWCLFTSRNTPAPMTCPTRPVNSRKSPPTPKDTMEFTLDVPPMSKSPVKMK